jgi:hypothetical protein
MLIFWHLRSVIDRYLNIFNRIPQLDRQSRIVHGE